jgi:hypothetical protein
MFEPELLDCRAGTGELEDIAHEALVFEIQFGCA